MWVYPWVGSSDCRSLRARCSQGSCTYGSPPCEPCPPCRRARLRPAAPAAPRNRLGAVRCGAVLGRAGRGGGVVRIDLQSQDGWGGVVERWTRLVLRHRLLVLAAWVAVFVTAGLASSKLSDLLTNRFILPGTDAQKAEQILQDHFGQRSTGSFTLVVDTGSADGAGDPAVVAAVARLRAGLEADPHVARVDFAAGDPQHVDASRPAAVRLRSRRRHPDRRQARPLAARPVRHEAVRSLQLVAAGGGGEGAPCASFPARGTQAGSRHRRTLRCGGEALLALPTG